MCPRGHFLFYRRIIWNLKNQQHIINRLIYYQAKYDGKFPLWVIVEFFSIGMLSHFYTDLQTEDKKAIARILYGTSYKNLESWLRCLTDLRNKCAHYSRIYYWIFPALPKIPRNDTYIPTRRLFAQLYVKIDAPRRK